MWLIKKSVSLRLQNDINRLGLACVYVAINSALDTRTTLISDNDMYKSNYRCSRSNCIIMSARVHECWRWCISECAAAAADACGNGCGCPVAAAAANGRPAAAAADKNGNCDAYSSAADDGP